MKNHFSKINIEISILTSASVLSLLRCLVLLNYIKKRKSHTCSKKRKNSLPLQIIVGILYQSGIFLKLVKMES